MISSAKWPSLTGAAYLLYYSLSDMIHRVDFAPYHYPTRDLQRKLSLMVQGVTVFTNHNHLNFHLISSTLRTHNEVVTNFSYTWISTSDRSLGFAQPLIDTRHPYHIRN